MSRDYGEDVAFLLVYIREAHPLDGWKVPANLKQGIRLYFARSFEEKDSHATLCVRKLDIEFPTLVDGMDNQAEKDYTAWPDRLYLVDREGKIAYKSAPGPQGFKPKQLEQAIRRELGLDAT